MKLALSCSIVIALCPAAVFGGIAVEVQRATHTHFFNSATEVDGIARIGALFSGVQEWKIPDLAPSDVGRLFTLTQDNAADYGFSWSTANGYFLDVRRDPFLSAGTVIDADTHVEEHFFRLPQNTFPRGLVDLQFQVLSWNDTVNPPAAGYKTLVVESRVHYLVPEPAGIFLMTLSMLVMTCWRFRR